MKQVLFFLIMMSLLSYLLAITCLSNQKICCTANDINKCSCKSKSYSGSCSSKSHSCTSPKVPKCSGSNQKISKCECV